MVCKRKQMGRSGTSTNLYVLDIPTVINGNQLTFEAFSAFSGAFSSRLRFSVAFFCTSLF
jgi:hypothetical protein